MSVVFNIGLYHYLIVALVIFCIGLWGIVVCKNIIRIKKYGVCRKQIK